MYNSQLVQLNRLVKRCPEFRNGHFVRTYIVSLISGKTNQNAEMQAQLIHKLFKPVVKNKNASHEIYLRNTMEGLYSVFVKTSKIVAR